MRYRDNARSRSACTVSRHRPPVSVNTFALVDRANATRAGASKFEGRSSNAFYFWRRIDAGIDGSLGAIGDLFAFARRSEIDAATQLTNDHHVAALNHIGTQSRRGSERRKCPYRTQIAEQIEFLTHPQELIDLSRLGWDLVVFRANRSRRTRLRQRARSRPRSPGASGRRARATRKYQTTLRAARC